MPERNTRNVWCCEALVLTAERRGVEAAEVVLLVHCHESAVEAVGVVGDWTTKSAVFPALG